MASNIVFASPVGDTGLSIRVRENADEVFKAWGRVSPPGSPIELTQDSSGEPIYVNGANVAYWEPVPDGDSDASAGD